jgi:pimeloyl-ACP methyl ester carboxylesterase
MFGPGLAFLFFFAPIVLGLNVAQIKTPQQSSKPPAAPSISLTPCEVAGANPAVKEKARCGAFEVFEDRNRKAGRKIALKIVVYPATGQDKAADPLFYIPGGPGSSATEDAPFVAQQFAKIREHRDLVFVDQRGTGGSNPLNCDFFNSADLQSYLGDYFPLPDVRKCREQLEPKADLKLYTTSIAMDDLEDVRRALGYQKINIIGGSYGTRATQVFLKQHPGSVRAIILHGVSPTNQFMPRDFPQHTERALSGVLAECAADKSCHEAFPNLEAEKPSVLERLLRGPIEVDIKRGTSNQNVRISLLTRPVCRSGSLHALSSGLGESHSNLYTPGGPGQLCRWRTPRLTIAKTLWPPAAAGMYLSVTCAEDVPLIKPGEGERNGMNTPSRRLSLCANSARPVRFGRAGRFRQLRRADHFEVCPL